MNRRKKDQSSAFSSFCFCCVPEHGLLITRVHRILCNFSGRCMISVRPACFVSPLPSVDGFGGYYITPRNIYQTIYVKLSEGKSVDDAKAALEKAYDGERFVTVLPGAAVPHTRHVRGRYSDKYSYLCFWLLPPLVGMYPEHVCTMLYFVPYSLSVLLGGGDFIIQSP